MRGEHNSKKGKRSFTILDTAEPHLILCKDNANEWKVSLLTVSRVQLILCKDKKKTVKHGVRHRHNVSMPRNNNINCIRRIQDRYPPYAYVSR